MTQNAGMPAGVDVPRNAPAQLLTSEGDG